MHYLLQLILTLMTTSLYFQHTLSYSTLSSIRRDAQYNKRQRLYADSDVNVVACANVAKCPMADKCSGSYRERGCDGTGKIQGGIATVSFLSWWPIKVFRPCPAYLEAGYVYRREGQTMDQVLFSEPSSKMKAKMDSMRKEEAEKVMTSMARRKADSPPESDDAQSELKSETEKFLEERLGKQ